MLQPEPIQQQYVQPVVYAQPSTYVNEMEPLKVKDKGPKGGKINDFNEPPNNMWPMNEEKYVFPLSDIPTDIFGRHLKDYKAVGKTVIFPPKWWLCYFCSYDLLDVEVTYSFYTEGVLEIKRNKIVECWGCCKNDLHTWRFVPRQNIDHIKVDHRDIKRCCGLTCGRCCECSVNNTLVDIVTRQEVANGVNEQNEQVLQCWGYPRAVAVKMDVEESQNFYLYCQNYTYNTNFHSARIYNMEFLKTIGEGKYSINPNDWVNYYVSTGLMTETKPVPQGRLGARLGLPGAASAGKAGDCCGTGGCGGCCGC